MATFYLDMVNGNNANDGLTPSTPKLTLIATTPLVTAYTDEIKVRGSDDFQIDIGTWRWEYGSQGITADGDKTGDISADEFCCITVDLSGSTVPEIMQVGTITYDAGDDETTIVWKHFNSTYHYYPHASYTGATSKIDTSGFNVTKQDTSKNGYIQSTSTSPLDFVLSKISGGWNAAYDAQTSYTGWYQNSTTDRSTGNADYWHFSRFVILGGGDFIMDDYNRMSDCFVGWNRDDELLDWDIHCGYTNCKLIMSYENDMLLNAQYCGFSGCTLLYTERAVKSIFASVIDSEFYDCMMGLCNNDYLSTYFDTGCIFTNCNFLNNNKSMFRGNTYNPIATFSGCTFIDKGSVENINFFTAPTGGNYWYFYDCDFDCTSNREMYYMFDYHLTLTNCTTINSPIYFGIQNGDYICTNNQFPPYYGLMEIVNVYANGYDDGLDAFSTINATDSAVTVYDTTGNTKVEKYGYTQLSDDAYTGDTCVKHYVTTNTADCTFQNVSFEVVASNSYTLDFYAKGSTAFSLEYNIKNGGEYIWDTWESMSVTTSYANENIAVSSADLNVDGTATLVFRIASQAKGTYALIDLITLS